MSTPGIVSLFRRTKFLSGAVAFFIMLTLQARAVEKSDGGVSFMQPPQGAQLIKIALSLQDRHPSRHEYLSQRSPQPLEDVTSIPAAIAKAYAGKEFSLFEMASLPNGTRYFVSLNQDKSLNFLNRTDTQIWYARIYRMEGDSQPKIVREGYQTSGTDVLIPVELQWPGTNAAQPKTIRTEIGYNISGMNRERPQVYSGRADTLTVTGSQMVEQGRLTASVTVPPEMAVTPDTLITLGFTSTEPGLPEHAASGKIGDFITVGAVRFIVTDLAPDFSSITFAIVSGSLEKTAKEQLQLGTAMPPFSQLDLVSRKAVTREQILESAKNSSCVVFVFGDLKGPSANQGYMPMDRGGSTLPLPAGEVAEQIALETTPKPLVVIVTRQISMEFLYQDLRNKTPDYLVLTDYSDALRTKFQMPQSGGFYPGQPYYSMSHEPTLRQVFNLANTLAIAVFDRSGKVIYVKADVGNDFLGSIAEARAACQTRK
ncbi:MAG: hypothetical protein ACXWJB_14010 [Limisphaerales bacterium]